jgi:UDP-N-acetylglucosamine--N-acetylmuramyl-(pentapeptide) pyrophosphoryl-undecaprenol N-acetylglucosamine transferase
MSRNDSSQKIDYMLVGGGSGGHITPLLAVASALKEKKPNCVIGVIGQKGEHLKEAFKDSPVDTVFYISAGKFRRYHGESVISHLLDFKTIALNIRDLFRFIKGTFDAKRLLKKTAPRAIFLKGGFVSVPVGYAARKHKIPYITHDSDAIPGLANRLTSKYAAYNTTALPAENYPYPAAKAKMVGIPLRPEFSLVTEKNKQEFREELGIKSSAPVIFCTGGGNGSRTLNELLAGISADLLKKFPDLVILHLTGKKLVDSTRDLYVRVLGADRVKNIQLFGFYPELYKLSGASDVVIARAGATNLAEFAVQGKAAVVVPSPFLTGGQQLHNAQILKKSEATMVVDEGDEKGLLESVQLLLSDQKQNQKYATNIQNLAVSDAASQIAVILQEIATSKD